MFRKELERLINCHSFENGSNTPDFILAQFLHESLLAFDRAVNERERWSGRREGWGDMEKVREALPPTDTGEFGLRPDIKGEDGP